MIMLKAFALIAISLLLPAIGIIFVLQAWFELSLSEKDPERNGDSFWPKIRLIGASIFTAYFIYKAILDLKEILPNL